MSGLSGEDRKRLRGLANQPSVNNAQARAIHSALTLIDQQEKALEAADELLLEIDGTCLCLGPGHVCGICKARDAYRSLRTPANEGES